MDKSEHIKQLLEKLPKQLSKSVDALEEPSIIENQMVELLLIHLRRADGFFLKEENHFRLTTPWVEILSNFAKEAPHILEKALSYYLSEHIKESFEACADGANDEQCLSVNPYFKKILVTGVNDCEVHYTKTLSELLAIIICESFKFDEPDFVDVIYNGDNSIRCVSHLQHVCGDEFKKLSGEVLFVSEIYASYKSCKISFCS